MRVTRWILAILCGFYSLINVVGLVVTYGAKGGWLPLPSNMPQLAPLVEAVSWWQAPIWLAVIILYLVVALRLIRGRSAFRVYMLALLLISFAGSRRPPIHTPLKKRRGIRSRLASLKATFTASLSCCLQPR